jgi:uncharacterized cupredoxin-like copper-binding protein
MNLVVPLLATIVLFSAPSAAFAHGDGAAGANAAAGHAATAFGHPGDAGKATRTIDVAMTDAMRFTPRDFTVKKGETIRFVVRNEGSVEHEMVLGTEASLREHAQEMRDMPGMAHVDPNMVRVKPGARGSFVWTFDKAGRFSVACLIPGHFEAGMKGSVVVR